MKRFTKRILRISAVLAVIGMVGTIVGVAMGGAKQTRSDVLGDRLSIHWNHWSDLFEEEDMEHFSDIAGNEITFDYDTITKLELDGKYGAFEVIRWDKDIFGIDVVKGEDNVKYSVENGVLKVASLGKSRFWKWNHIEVKVRIYVPADITPDDMKFKIGAGELKCQNISAKQLSVDIGAGEATFENISAETADIKVGAGEGEILSSQLGSCNVNVGIGEFTLQGTITGNVDVDCGMGEIDMKLTNAYRDFNYALKVGAGEIEINESEYHGTSNMVKLENGAEKTMAIQCGMGEVTVKLSGM